MQRVVLIVLGIIIVAVGGLWLLFYSSRSQESNLDNFAKCLSDKGITMYGAYWCPHCQNEKNAFGDSFQFVNYVECTEETNKCLAKGIDSYPTWIFPDGRRFVGEQGITKLGELSGCPI